ncbi:MAG: hypothetical protein HC884_07740 [Chloroflexaceae bacterium]|nr:hypothetical protein [Chloroflexaceae bacterium]
MKRENLARRSAAYQIFEIVCLVAFFSMNAYALSAALAARRLEATSPDRVRAELCLALEEPDPASVLHLADTLEITPHIYPPLRWSEAAAARCARVPSTLPVRRPWGMLAC